MTLMEKHSNANRIFETNKYTPTQQRQKIEITSDLEATITTCSMPQNVKKSNYEEESRRSSGNSITIKITNDENVTMDEESLENILNENYSILSERERRDDHDIEAEDTTSLENYNDIERSYSKKKLKDRKKFVRSAAQQKHHLEYQESEDRPDAVQAVKQAYQSQNSAFDELFAAANTGNFIQSAHVEAKMAIAARKNDNPSQPEEVEQEKFPYNCNFVSARSRSSLRNRASFKNTQPTENKTSPRGSPDKILKNSHPSNGLKAVIDSNLGTPNQLTRSQSCKRPSSFKRMRSRNNADPINKTHSPTAHHAPTNTQPANITGRRGTHGSINTSDLEKSRCGSLPFENINGDQDEQEIHRVRQFNITNKGIVNRGDSFKRSFKRSNNSLSSKKDISPNNTETGNTLNLPDMYDGYIVNKSSNTSSNNGLNEAGSVDTSSKSAHSSNDNNSVSLKNVTLGKKGAELQASEAKTYLVYMIGASSVGKNALIKQFKTSEYRGTYDIDSTQVIDDSEEGVTIALDGIESILQFVSMDIDMLKLSTLSLFEITRDNDAFVVVYSISDKASFNIAIDLLKSVRLSENRSQPVILVGNKSDLVRKRSISREDARKVAVKFGCKFVETSVAINDKVDDLLAGILKQIRIHEGTDINSSGDTNRPSRDQTREKSGPRKHGRNHSDLCSEGIQKINENSHFDRSAKNFLSFRGTSLSRRLFRKNTQMYANSPYLDKDNLESKKKFTDKVHFTDQQSFFHKVINNIFKKRPDPQQTGSVENLYTPPSMN